jgi:hypothetical protein
MNVAVAIKPRTVLQSRKVMMSILMMAIVVGVLLYMYLLTMAVVHVVMRKEATELARTLESEIAALETEFMVAQHVVSSAIVKNQQFTQTSEKIFVKRNQDSLVAVSRE